MPTLEFSITRPTDDQQVDVKVEVTEDEASRLLEVSTNPAPGVHIGASAQISEDDVQGLLDLLVDMTNGSMALSGSDPDEPVGLVPDMEEFTDAEALGVYDKFNGETT